MATRKDHPENTDAGKAAKAKAEAAEADVTAEVADKMAEAQARGYIGDRVDPRSDDEYTVAGQLATNRSES